MNPKDLEQLERFTAAALSGLCANQEIVKTCATIDQQEKVAEGRTLSCCAVAIAAQAINTLKDYVSNQPSTSA